MDIYLQAQTQSFQHHSPVGKWQNFQSKLKKKNPREGLRLVKSVSQASCPCTGCGRLREWNALIGQVAVGLALGIQVSGLGVWGTGVAKIKVG